MPFGRTKNIIINGYSKLLYARFQLGDQNMTKEVFSKIYESSVWGNHESKSGLGSTLCQTEKLIPLLTKLFQKLNICHLLDLPCGDFNWMQHVKYKKHYIGADIVSELTAKNRKLYGDKNHEFLTLDLLTDDLPKVDAILCRDCLVHLSFEDAVIALKNMKASGTRYLLTTDFVKHTTNKNISTGNWRPISLQYPPYCFPEPIHTLNEGYHKDQYSDKSLCVWELKSIDVEILEKNLLANQQHESQNTLMEDVFSGFIKRIMKPSDGSLKDLPDFEILMEAQNMLYKAVQNSYNDERSKGKKEGIQRKSLEIAQKMKKKAYSVEEIVELTGVKIEDSESES